ncbi:MAG: hypothetical protein JWM86_944 [Thermoleophilia bacterium]|nr:hypothetical protein [Thermoleophilia bacterium]
MTMRAPLDALAPTPSISVTLAAPRPANVTGSSGDLDFGAVLASARTAEDPPRATDIDLGQLLKLIQILLLLGVKVPEGMIRMLRAHGMASYADSIMVRNTRIDEDEAAERARILRAAQAGSTRTTAA